MSNFEGELLAIYKNIGDSNFRHQSKRMGLSSVGRLAVGWGLAFADFNQDGIEELFVSNGHIVRYPQNSPRKQLPFLLRLQQGRLHNVADESDGYLAQAHYGRGLACGDIDLDGDMDLAVSRVNQSVAVLLNESLDTGHWLKVRLVGRVGDRQAIGATVVIETGAGIQSRQLVGGSSYASTHAPDVHFGLGDATSIDRITVRWPSGIDQVLTGLPTDECIVLREPTADSKKSATPLHYRIR